MKSMQAKTDCNFLTLLPWPLTFWPCIYQVLGGQLCHKIWEFLYSGEEGFNPTNFLSAPYRMIWEIWSNHKFRLRDSHIPIRHILLGYYEVINFLSSKMSWKVFVLRTSDFGYSTFIKCRVIDYCIKVDSPVYSLHVSCVDHRIWLPWSTESCHVTYEAVNRRSETVEPRKVFEKKIKEKHD